MLSRRAAGLGAVCAAAALGVVTWSRTRRDHDRAIQDPWLLYPGLPLVLPQIERVVDAQERRLAGIDQRGGVLLGLAGLLSVVVISADITTSPLVVVGVVAAGVAAVLSMLAILPRVADDLDPTGMIEDLSLLDQEEVRVQLAATQAALYAQEQGQVALARRTACAGRRGPSSCR